MHDFDRFALGPLAHWWEGSGTPACGCPVNIEILTAPNGATIVSHCPGCGTVFFADEADAAA